MIGHTTAAAAAAAGGLGINGNSSGGLLNSELSRDSRDEGEWQAFDALERAKVRFLLYCCLVSCKDWAV